MVLKKEIIVMGDIELGAGNLTDDFIADCDLSELIRELSRRKHSVDLVLNGDTFDFLKCPYFDRNRLIYPRHVTEEISLGKLKLIYAAHRKVFNALKIFVRKKRHRLFFIIGNHDFDLVHPGIQDKLKELLRDQKNIFFEIKYHYHQVYAEHGQQYDFLNRLNMQKLFLNYKGKTILNLPFVSFSIIGKFLQMKEDHPFLERIFPRPTLFSFHRPLAKKLTWRSLVYAVKSVFYYPFRYFTDPTYSLPRELFRSFYLKFKSDDWDIDKIIDPFKKEKKKILKKNKIYVLSHIHEKYIEEKKGRVIIHPGSWRDEYDLDQQSRKLIPRFKRYVQILVAGEELEYQLIDMPNKRNMLDFDKVINNEMFYIRKAAKEEKYTSSFL